MTLQAQSKPFFEGSPKEMSTLASSAPILGLQWAGPGSTDAALALLVAAGAATASQAAALTAEEGAGKGKGGGLNYFMAGDSVESTLKAKTFFEQWDEDKSTSLKGGDNRG